ncbi:MAG TPA: hypothetical protein VME18_02495 [Acidobacteriaceae bacterium]|nr:hypothetical protein [Acidobacteriaceae bacterium]
MKFTLGPTGRPGDPFGYDRPLVVEINSPTRKSTFLGSDPGEWFPSEHAKLDSGDIFEAFGSGGGEPASMRFVKISLPPIAKSDFAGLGDGPASGPAIKLTPIESSDFAGLEDIPEADDAAFIKRARNAAATTDIDAFAEGGQIIESESLYRSSTGFEVLKRVVVSKSGRERTVVSCPGHLCVI